MKISWRLIVSGVVAVVIASALGLASRPVNAQARAGGFETRTLSTRAETISGGDVLVQVKTPSNVGADRISVTLNGRDLQFFYRS